MSDEMVRWADADAGQAEVTAAVADLPPWLRAQVLDLNGAHNPTRSDPHRASRKLIEQAELYESVPGVSADYLRAAAACRRLASLRMSGGIR